tara:strand:+ start:41857 stop:41991 length:135 start_codon:yes stop_codon:yes gene_type:complete
MGKININDIERYEDESPQRPQKFKQKIKKSSEELSVIDYDKQDA